MFFKKTDYVVVSVSDDQMEVRIKATNKLVTVQRAVGEILIDFDNSQYNSDHRFERHNDKTFFKNDGTEVQQLVSLPDRATPEIASIYEQEKILLDLIAKDDARKRQRLADLLPAALATLTTNQRYAIKRHYLDGIKKKQIAEELNVTPQMMTKYFKAALTSLRKFYQVNK